MTGETGAAESVRLRLGQSARRQHRAGRGQARQHAREPGTLAGDAMQFDGVETRIELRQRRAERCAQQVECDTLIDLRDAPKARQRGGMQRDVMQAGRPPRIVAPALQQRPIALAIAVGAVENGELRTPLPVHGHYLPLCRKQSTSWSSTMPIPCM